ncbi:CHRD domain-containing protein [Methylomonas sp. BW4-1]|uniref:CHRD domain-containing protein n=1 Tax=unclassified Methylomonas TaxID=2608980 RepID=UPI00051BEBD0|nr:MULTISPECIES: CHRD domain-containing protein [unclassified Methylomonas]PKD39403.1 CHRD domain-containing protein [Methylomonas sp. Kb3]QBC25705.1 CHRD domain-containing protein [Methylomonas sp. LW13]
MKSIMLLLALLSASLTSIGVAAHELSYAVVLSGPNEAPPNSSLGFGSGTVTFDLDLVTMRVNFSFSGLQGNTTAAHIHCCTSVAGAATAGVASQTPSFVGFPLGVTSGSMDQTFDLSLASSYNATFITNNGGTVSSALNALLVGAEAGKAYLNIHTSLFPGGEIRGFLQPAAVPLPAAIWLFGSVVGVFSLSRCRRQV